MTAAAASQAARWGPRLPAGALDAMERTLAWCAPRLPLLGKMVADNMRSARIAAGPDGTDEADLRAAVRGYFRQTALHLANGMRAFRRGRDGPALIDLAREQIGVDASIAHLRAALSAGRGALVATAHVCNYLLTLARLNQDVPLCVYLRWSDDARKRELKRRWCEAAGVRIILEAEDATDPTRRAAVCVEALRGGAALVMTPDIAQKRGRGVPVRLFERTAELPSGPASIAMLAEAPLVPVFGRIDGAGHRIIFAEPFDVRRPSRSEGGRAEGLRRAMQSWASEFERFVRACPQAWFLWADSRWTRVFRGDPDYCAPLEGHAGADPASDVTARGRTRGSFDDADRPARRGESGELDAT